MRRDHFAGLRGRFDHIALAEFRATVAGEGRVPAVLEHRPKTPFTR